MTQILELGMDMALLARGGASLDFLHVLFLVRPDVEQCQLVARQIKSIRRLRGSCERFNIYFTPHKTLVAEQVHFLFKK